MKRITRKSLAPNPYQRIEAFSIIDFNYYGIFILRAGMLRFQRACHMASITLKYTFLSV